MPPKRTDANKGWSEDEDPLPAKRLKIRPAEEPGVLSNRKSIL